MFNENQLENNFKEDHRYDDMVNLPHHVSAFHPQMPVSERAAQFSPFAALTGYDDAVRETGRLTDTKIELEEDAKEILDEKLRMMQERIEEHPMAEITYFQPDDKKEGGFYVTVSGNIKKIDGYKKSVIMQNGMEICIEDISDISMRENYTLIFNQSK